MTPGSSTVAVGQELGGSYSLDRHSELEGEMSIQSRIQSSPESSPVQSPDMSPGFIT